MRSPAEHTTSSRVVSEQMIEGLGKVEATHSKTGKLLVHQYHWASFIEDFRANSGKELVGLSRFPR